MALDVSLLMQTEVSEVFEPSAAGRGGSSSLPHKRNPAMAAEILAACRRAEALAGVVLAGMPQEHERAVGAWQAEWQTVSELCRAAGGAVSFCRRHGGRPGGGHCPYGQATWTLPGA